MSVTPAGSQGPIKANEIFMHVLVVRCTLLLF